MNYSIIKRSLLNSIIVTVLCNCCIYSQECDEGYTYFDTLPANVTNINNETNCFHDNDILALNDLIEINSFSFDSPLEIGTQTWVSNRLVSWVSTYTPN